MRIKIRNRWRKIDAPEVDIALARQLNRFREHFGRDPGPDDPVFFDPNYRIPRPIEASDITQQIAAVMRAAGISEEKIYATEKTGLIPTEGNAKFLTKKDWADWNAAINEYREKHKP